MAAMSRTLEPIDTEPPPSPGRRWLRRGVVIPVAIVVLGLVVFVLVWFQPQKLFIDDKVDQDAPVGATPITPATPSTSVAPTTPATTAAAAPATLPGTVAQTAPTVPPATASPTTVPAPVPPAPTQFVSLDHGTTGNLLVLQDAEGVRYVRFEAFETDNGPDLFVYLSTNPVDGSEQAFDDDFVNLGRLQGNIGDQNYALPPDVDLSRFQSVVVWCDRFNSAFGAAPLV
jgi:hypothetical protein